MIVRRPRGNASRRAARHADSRYSGASVSCVHSPPLVSAPLSIASARALHLAAQGLLTPPRRKAVKADVLAAVRRMGQLQIDTIHVVARSPYLVLFSRLGAYAPQWLDEHLADAKLFEYWSHEACFLPIEDFGLMRHKMLNPIGMGWKYAAEWHAQHRDAIDALLAHVRARGPVRSADFARGAGKGNGWWDWKPEKRHLEVLFSTGQLMVAERRNFQRVYDVAERVLPDWDDARDLPPRAAVVPRLVGNTCRALGIVRADWIADYYRLPKRSYRDELHALADAGELLPVAVDGWHADAFVHRELAPLVDAARDLISLGKSAGYAWRETIRAQTAVLADVDDTLLAERAADLRDIDKRVLRALGYASASARELPAEAVLAAEEFTPSDLASLDRERVAALVMARGGATSHAAIIARQLGIPALVAVGDALYAIAQRTQVVVDASAGRLEYAPSALDVERARHERQRLAGVREANRRMSGEAALTRDGHRIEVAANIATLDDARVALDNGADAVGLLRTELMFIHRQAAPTASEHQQSYQSIVDALQGRTAIIRTLDVGADKEVDYLTLPPEPNPALGLRGIRLAQVRPDLLDDQLRGLLAVKPYGSVRILLPMVTDVGELVRIRKRIDDFARAMGRAQAVEVGVMIEVPSAALLADQLAQHADFLSIGTNDLTQYTLAMDRCQADLAAQADGLHPAVLRLVDATVRGAEKHGKWVGVCGALGGDPVAVPVLVGLGVTELSVDPVSVPGIKAQVRRLDYQLCRQRAQDLLALESAQAVRAASREIWPAE